MFIYSEPYVYILWTLRPGDMVVINILFIFVNFMPLI